MKIEGAFNKIINLCYRLMILLTIVLLAFSNAVKYSEFHRRTFWLPNVLMMILGVLIIWGMKLAARKLVGAINWLAIAFLLISVLFSVCSMYITGWDAGTVLDAALSVARGTDQGMDFGYFSTYPNNRLEMVLLVEMFRLGIDVGIKETAGLYCALVVIQCALFWATGLMLFDIIRRLTGDEETAVFGYLLYELFIGIAPWTVIVYTDSLGIIFPILLMWLYISASEGRFVVRCIKWIMIVAVSLVGISVKTTSAVVLIAMIIALFITALGKERRWERAAGMCAASVMIALLGLLLSTGLEFRPATSLFEKTTGTKVNDEMELSFWHYLMMGLNNDSDGTFNYADSDFSTFISDRGERVSREKGS